MRLAERDGPWRKLCMAQTDAESELYFALKVVLLVMYLLFRIQVKFDSLIQQASNSNLAVWKHPYKLWITQYW